MFTDFTVLKIGEKDKRLHKHNLHYFFKNAIYVDVPAEKKEVLNDTIYNSMKRCVHTTILYINGDMPQYWAKSFDNCFDAVFYPLFIQRTFAWHSRLSLILFHLLNLSCGPE